MAMVPLSFCNSTVSISLVLDTPVMAFFIYLFSVALWKYLEAVNLLMYLRIFLPVPPDWLVLENRTDRASKVVYLYIQTETYTYKQKPIRTNRNLHIQTETYTYKQKPVHTNRKLVIW